jgi:hypothetical protein
MQSRLISTFLMLQRGWASRKNLGLALLSPLSGKGRGLPGLRDARGLAGVRDSHRWRELQFDAMTTDDLVWL